MKNGFLFLALLVAHARQAAELRVQVAIPQLDVAEYHRPYVAVWIENDQRKTVAQISHWLEQEKWHRDLRSWWRRGGKSLALPVDGVTGATRKPGRYELVQQLELMPGKYVLNVEAVREVGGREHIKLPFVWQGKSLTSQQQGKHELGAVAFTLAP
ncbi:DUF2271 domain-containing protein [Simiduia agarivorans]|uniref:DUF2271 domain-containing protein n=1 Tax=Simiduia agarivorans (strain DSM 21679 / JCM 13881 / BCRC 17597 / SA1) TaxID=1117647 RepID=K4KP79_SIMAS|nr:DUF2271 domain-containing protein [Simiduia agarivorans]AFV00046.1 hypothetical protein M5M_14545 [Simiduia agarivorans SA1 = DSM 21679]